MKISNLTFDAADPERLCAFWVAALGYAEEEPPAGLLDELRAAGWTEEDLGSRRAAYDPAGIGPRLYFQRVPEGKQAKNRLHIDIAAAEGRRAERAEVDAEVRRLIDLGASRLHVHDGMLGPFPEYHHVMVDPEGNEFCVQ